MAAFYPLFKTQFERVECFTPKFKNVHILVHASASTEQAKISVQ